MILTSDHVVIGDLLTIKTVGGVHLTVPTHGRLPEQLDQQLSLKAPLQLIIVLTGGGQQVENILIMENDDLNNLTIKTTLAPEHLSSPHVFSNKFPASI